MGTADRPIRRRTVLGRFVGFALGARALALAPFGVFPAVLGRVGAVAVPRGYLVPGYTPPGYELVQVYEDRPDGFGGGTGEIALWYAKRKDPSSFNRPLTVFQARAVTRPFGATEHRSGRSQEITLAGGTRTSATYHDGLWAINSAGARVWERRGAHSLQVQINGLTVAIRGDRAAGVTYSDLLSVAASLQPAGA